MARGLSPFDDEFVVGRQTGRAVNRPGFGTNELTGTPTTGAATQPGYEDVFTPWLETLGSQRIEQLQRPFSDPMLDEVVGLIRGRVGQIQSTPTGFSAQEEDRLNTRAWDGLERRRTAAKQRATEDAARRGLGESSGVIQEQYRDIDSGFDSDRTRAEADTNIWMSQEENSRRNQQTSQLMQLAGMLSQVAGTRRAEERTNQNDILQIATMLSNIGPSRLAQLMGVVNGVQQPNIAGAFSNQLNLSNSQTAQSQYDSQGRAAMMAGLGQLIGAIMSGNGGSSTTGDALLPDYPYA